MTVGSSFGSGSVVFGVDRCSATEEGGRGFSSDSLVAGKDDDEVVGTGSVRVAIQLIPMHISKAHRQESTTHNQSFVLSNGLWLFLISFKGSPSNRPSNIGHPRRDNVAGDSF